MSSWNTSNCVPLWVTLIWSTYADVRNPLTLSFGRNDVEQVWLFCPEKSGASGSEWPAILREPSPRRNPGPSQLCCGPRPGGLGSHRWHNPLVWCEAHLSQCLSSGFGGRFAQTGQPQVSKTLFEWPRQCSYLRCLWVRSRTWEHCIGCPSMTQHPGKNILKKQWNHIVIFASELSFFWFFDLSNSATWNLRSFRSPNNFDKMTIENRLLDDIASSIGFSFEQHFLQVWFLQFRYDLELSTRWWR